MDTAIAALIAAGLATTGWLYTARRARTLARKQHTVNVMLQASLNKDFLAARNLIAPYVKKRNLPLLAELEKDDNKDILHALRMILNHYEFMAAGVRNGDFEEFLLRDSERGTIITVYTGSSDFIWALRNNRSRMTIYEHLEWLHDRWETKRPKWHQRWIERVRGSPFAGKRINHP
jgi:hypothetical protein